MTLLYRALTTFFYPLLIIIILFRVLFKKEDPKRYKEKIFSSHFNVIKKKERKLIWFHAASIGEYKSIIPIIKELNKNFKNLNILITTVTLSSSNLANTELQKFSNIIHRFFPIDINFLIKKFLELWRPDMIFLVDSEIWPNLILLAKKNKIPISLLNARLSKKTFKKWMLFPGTSKNIFSVFKFCIASNIETKNYLKKLKAKNVNFYGNIKLINENNKIKTKNKNKKILLKKRFWIAASVHKGEDIFCMRVHYKLKKRYKDIITIVAPRHIDRVQHIKVLSENFNFKTQILNRGDTILKNKELIIINSFGVLKNYFRYAKSVFVGKSVAKEFEENGGQNPIEAANLNCKIYHGPYVHNFKDIYEIYRKKNISVQIKKEEELSNYLINDLKSTSKNNTKIPYQIKNLGEKILNSTMKDIKKLLNQ
tara:strand:+ start:2673 stop:3947 length:1275 start_codon:yes stop_codon:yes gene_type:complete